MRIAMTLVRVRACADSFESPSGARQKVSFSAHILCPTKEELNANNDCEDRG